MSSDSPPKETFYTTQQVAEILGVTARTVQLWAESGVLEAWKTPGGHRRIKASELSKLRNHMQNPSEKVSGDVLYKILIVDDNSTFLDLCCLRLEQWGLPIQLITASDGYEALIKLGAEKPDMIIVDLMMPRINGFHLLKVIRGEPTLSDMVVVVVSGLEKKDIEKHGGVPEGIKVLHKPEPFGELKQIIIQSIQKSAESRQV